MGSGVAEAIRRDRSQPAGGGVGDERGGARCAQRGAASASYRRERCGGAAAATAAVPLEARFERRQRRCGRGRRGQRYSALSGRKPAQGALEPVQERLSPLHAPQRSRGCGSGGCRASGGGGGNGGERQGVDGSRGGRGGVRRRGRQGARGRWAVSRSPRRTARAQGALPPVRRETWRETCAARTL